jgi:Mn2+/Fe2+ NRAMP family transporter
MEGFLDIKLPIYQRVLLTRSIALVPALSVCILNQDALTNMDVLLNVLQSFQLPFALIPLIKFVSNEKIMLEFCISNTQFWFATLFGIALFCSNLYMVSNYADYSSFSNIGLTIFAMLGYFTLLVKVMIEPVKPLKEMS